MLSYIARRAIGSIVVLILISIITFLLAYAIPGDPARMIVGAKATPMVVAQVRQNLGLDQPLAVQYVHYLVRLLHGDLGFSYHNNLPVTQLLSERIGNTAQLAFGGWLVELIIGIPIGIVTALYHRKWADYVFSSLSLIGMSFPVFLLGMLLIYFVGFKAQLLPLSGSGGIQNLIMPSITLGVTGAAVYQRLVRSSMIEVFAQDYVRTARASGVSGRRMVTHHALRNGMIPALTYAGMDIGTLCGGLVLTETVFNYPGIGLLSWQSIQNLDFPVIMATVLVAAVFVVIANFAVDIVYSVIDPRISLG
jgi:ABC-type dipeptide/oligopeptide/nickel transport system permease component